jgi:hypothetical protein
VGTLAFFVGNVGRTSVSTLTALVVVVDDDDDDAGVLSAIPGCVCVAASRASNAANDDDDVLLVDALVVITAVDTASAARVGGGGESTRMGDAGGDLCCCVATCREISAAAAARCVHACEGDAHHIPPPLSLTRTSSVAAAAFNVVVALDPDVPRDIVAVDSVDDVDVVGAGTEMPSSASLAACRARCHQTQSDVCDLTLAAASAAALSFCFASSYMWHGTCDRHARTQACTHASMRLRFHVGTLSSAIEALGVLDVDAVVDCVAGVDDCVVCAGVDGNRFMLAGDVGAVTAAADAGVDAARETGTAAAEAAGVGVTAADALAATQRSHTTRTRSRTFGIAGAGEPELLVLLFAESLATKHAPTRTDVTTYRVHLHNNAPVIALQREQLLEMRLAVVRALQRSIVAQRQHLSRVIVHEIAHITLLHSVHRKQVL